MEKYELNEEQTKAFMKVKAGYGGGGAFFGMCMNQAADLNLPFEKVLQQNLDVQNRLEATFEAGKEEVKSPVVKHEVIK